MEKLMLFIIEHTLVNIAPILLAIGTVSFIFGKFLVNVGANNWVRIVIYSITGLIGGLTAYAQMTIPNRVMEFSEALSLSAGMLILSAAITSTVIFIKSAITKNKTT